MSVEDQLKKVKGKKLTELGKMLKITFPKGTKAAEKRTLIKAKLGSDPTLIYVVLDDTKMLGSIPKEDMRKTLRKMKKSGVNGSDISNMGKSECLDHIKTPEKECVDVVEYLNGLNYKAVVRTKICKYLGIGKVSRPKSQVMPEVLEAIKVRGLKVSDLKKLV